MIKQTNYTMPLYSHLKSNLISKKNLQNKQDYKLFLCALFFFQLNRVTLYQISLFVKLMHYKLLFTINNELFPKIVFISFEYKILFWGLAQRLDRKLEPTKLDNITMYDNYLGITRKIQKDRLCNCVLGKNIVLTSIALNQIFYYKLLFKKILFFGNQLFIFSKTQNKTANQSQVTISIFEVRNKLINLEYLINFRD
ncbi:hypothetical protein ABPG72_001716 [Tetrahymena utriculariae]